MAERSHLSIGEVLSLLRDEFPDVTISKIRFLESQGLVDPERTPSGYRKFYDHDVERLRWILRQQREHFLPLKVIRGRLSEQGEPGSPAEVAAEIPADVPAEVAAAGPSAPVANGSGLAAAPTAAPAPARRAPGTVPSLFAGLHDHDAAHSSSEPAPQPPAAPAREPAAPRPAAAAPPQPPANHQLPEPAAPRPAAASPVSGAHNVPAPTPEPEPEDATPTPASPNGPGPSPSSGAPPVPEPSRAPAASPTGGPGRPAAGRPAAGRPAQAVTDEPDTYTAEELAGTVGAEATLVAELKQYGLIAPHAVVAGIPYYDDSALAVARAAADLGRHGVEVRHLRIWRNAADREADLFQQVVLPLLRQRNPQARRQAFDTLAELAAAGADLRAALVERALREIR